jgi:hypothetical protein
MTNTQLGTLEGIPGNGVQERQNKYVEHINRIMRTKILGTFVAPSQWRFPLTKEGTMGTLSMTNSHTRRVMNWIDLIIIEASISDVIKKERLLRCFRRYRAAMIILRKSTDYSEEEILTFQDHVEAWFRDWLGKGLWTRGVHKLYPHAVVLPCHEIYAGVEVFASILATRMGGFKCSH